MSRTPSGLHALCLAHILRELIFIHEECDQVWAKELADLLLDMNQKGEEHKLYTSNLPPEELQEWHQQYQEILCEGRVANPPIIPMTDAPKKRGVKLFVTIRSYISTVRKQGHSIFQDLKSAIVGSPFIPVSAQSK